MESFLIILVKLVFGVVAMYPISKFVDFDVLTTDTNDKRYNTEDIAGDPQATALYAAAVYKSKMMFYTVYIAVMIFVSFM